jgi:hypothetical protein
MKATEQKREDDLIDLETGEVLDVRSRAQNRRFHAMVRDVAEQVQWAGELMDEEDWKRLFLAAKYGQRVVPNPLDPHKPFIVVNVRRSRDLPKPNMADLITEIQVFGNERGVKWGAE